MIGLSHRSASPSAPNHSCTRRGFCLRPMETNLCWDVLAEPLVSRAVPVCHLSWQHIGAQKGRRIRASNAGGSAIRVFESVRTLPVERSLHSQPAVEIVLGPQSPCSYPARQNRLRYHYRHLDGTWATVNRATRMSPREDKPDPPIRADDTKLPLYLTARHAYRSVACPASNHFREEL